MAGVPFEALPFRTFDCPACEGICRRAEIKAAPWRIARNPTCGVPYAYRKLTMTCPHCGHVESLTESREVDR